jgi:hypothetical protein
MSPDGGNQCALAAQKGEGHSRVGCRAPGRERLHRDRDLGVAPRNFFYDVCQVNGRKAREKAG